MSKDVQNHQRLVNETGKFKFTDKQTDVMRILLDGTELELEEDKDPDTHETMNLPILGGE